ncbi:MAG: CopG family transcriptional regulator [Burkholderiales bacterium]|jgi:hypothetical protein
MAVAKTRLMSTHVPVPLSEHLEKLAALEAVRHPQTLEALAQVDAHQSVSHQDVKAWAASLGTDQPKLLPD